MESRSADVTPRFEIFELTLTHDGKYRNNFSDVNVTVVFTSPEGMQHPVGGFYYRGDQWKARFRPDQPGTWRYSYKLAATGGYGQEGRGTFQCIASGDEGPVHADPENSFRWVFASGRPFFPIGLQDCVFQKDGALGGISIDGEERSRPGPKISWDQYFATYGEAGFNLFRFSQKNCSFLLTVDLDHIRVMESIATDELLSLARKHGVRVMFGFFGIHGQFPSGNRVLRVLKRAVFPVLGIRREAVMHPDDHVTVAKEKRFIDYCIARWGVYADFWELLNERDASDEWTTLMAKHVRAVDPDRKPISTSWEKPHLPVIDINAPHWYEAEDELMSDLRVHERAAAWKRAGKPVVVAEQGNAGMNWDPRSATRMRIRLWTSFFEEISLVFWNTSWSKAGVNQGRTTPGALANIYLGPEERGYVRVLSDFTSRLDAGLRMSTVSVSSPSLIRAYGLASSAGGAVYLHHGDSHVTRVESARITLDRSSLPSGTLRGEWLDPMTGHVISEVALPAGQAVCDVPPFTIDIALRVRSVRYGSTSSRANPRPVS